jgi:hypothetical protein
VTVCARGMPVGREHAQLKAQASRSILTSGIRQSAKCKLHTALRVQQLIHRLLAIHDGCIEAIAWSCGGAPVMHTNARPICIWQPFRGVAEPKAPYEHYYLKPLNGSSAQNSVCILYGEPYSGLPLIVIPRTKESPTCITSDWSKLRSWGTSNELPFGHGGHENMHPELNCESRYQASYEVQALYR